MKEKIIIIFILIHLLLNCCQIGNTTEINKVKNYNIIESNYTQSICVIISDLEPGDIAFKHPDIFPDYLPAVIDHCLLFIEYNNETEKYVFIEAGIHNSCVQYRYETKQNISSDMWGPFARVRYANQIQKENAINFTKRQLGKKFQGEFFGINADKNFNPNDTVNDIYANEWYCSELIWAAYYNCNNPFPEEEPQGGYIYGDGIDIDRNKWKKNIFGHTYVWPKEIYNNILYVQRLYLK